jgi:hydrogenase-4 membrane subunit HyfE
MGSFLHREILLRLLILHCAIDDHGVIEHCAIYSLGVLTILGTFFTAFAAIRSSSTVASGGSAEALGVDLVHVFAALALIGEGGQWSMVGGRVREDNGGTFDRTIVLARSL